MIKLDIFLLPRLAINDKKLTMIITIKNYL